MNLKLHTFREEAALSPLAPLTGEVFFAHFKEVYLKSLSQKRESTFEELLERSQQELEVQELSQELKETLQNWYLNIHELSFIENELQKNNLREIIIHNEREIQSESQEGLVSNFIHLSAKDYQTALEVLALKHHQAWNYSQPFVSFTVHLKGRDYRATLVHEAISPLKKSKLFLRRLSCQSLSLEDFELPEDVREFLRQIINEKKNVLIAGATGSGKTTFLKSLFKEIPKEEHLVVIEDTHELGNSHPQTSFLLGENTPHKTMKDHCAYALRMRPDRIVIGEMRSHEVVPFLLAMNTGHKGLLSTLHANSAQDALSRLGLLFSLYSENSTLSYELIMKLVCRNIEYVVYLEERKVKQVIKVLGVEDARPYFNYVWGEEQAHDEPDAYSHRKISLQ